MPVWTTTTTVSVQVKTAASFKAISTIFPRTKSPSLTPCRTSTASRTPTSRTPWITAECSCLTSPIRNRSKMKGSHWRGFTPSVWRNPLRSNQKNPLTHLVPIMTLKPATSSTLSWLGQLLKDNSATMDLVVQTSRIWAWIHHSEITELETSRLAAEIAPPIQIDPAPTTCLTKFKYSRNRSSKRTL